MHSSLPSKVALPDLEYATLRSVLGGVAFRPPRLLSKVAPSDIENSTLHSVLGGVARSEKLQCKTAYFTK